MTHKSRAYEEGSASNERLEFLGDAVLGLVVGEYLFRELPGAPEGRLAKLRAAVISAPTLARQAGLMELGSYLRLGRGETLTGGRTRESNLADAFEALVGAFYIAGGLGAAAKFILDELGGEIDDAVRGGNYRDFKTTLQEEMQRTGNKPCYEVTKEEGPDHGKVFTVVVSAGGRVLGRGKGRSKKEAEQSAARQALENLRDLAEDHASRERKDLPRR